MPECNQCDKEVGSVFSSDAGEPARCLRCIEADGERLECCDGCGESAKAKDLTEFQGSPYCDGCHELAHESWVEWQAEMDGPDPHGYRDPTPEESAGWAMQDKIDMYRNEY